MIAPEVLTTVGTLTLVRWRDPGVPPGLPALIAEAEASGIAWIATFPAEWATRPFLAMGEALFLALQNGDPVAMAVISADPHVDDSETGRLRYIYVARAMRGRGLARVFVAASLEHGRRRWRRIRLHTDNPAAARIYESFGFVPVDSECRSTHRLECGQPKRPGS